MRYTFQLIPGLPVAPDIGIGVRLTPLIPPPAPATAAAAPAPPATDGDPQSLWALHPYTGAGDDVATFERNGDAFDGFNPAQSTPPGAFVTDFDYYDVASLIAVAIVKNAPDGSVVTWDVSAPTIALGSGTISDDGGGSYSINFDGNLHYLIRVLDNKVRCAYMYARWSGSGYAAWALNPITLTASIDGVPLRTLTLNVSALEFGGF